MTEAETQAEPALPRIWVDADACPTVIRDILFRAAERVGIPVEVPRGGARGPQITCPPLTQSDPATFSELYWPGLSSEWISKAEGQAQRWNRLLPPAGE